MRRLVVILFLFLYFYNIVGYLGLIAVVQHRVRTEVKQLLKSSVPESTLITLAFPTHSLRSSYVLQWLDDHEFRYGKNLYDIVRSFTRGDTTYLVCLNDTQEEVLFEHLDDHVQRQMGTSGLADRLDAFKEVFKNSLRETRPLLHQLWACGSTYLFPIVMPAQFEPTPSAPPPRHCSVRSV
ncbi:MAG TPA: hypothetical protein VNL69_04360 [Bacteroidota bacterium]|nr:hypothetical protein [Bacteroidota bacterium]